MGSIDLVDVSFQYEKGEGAREEGAHRPFLIDDLSLHCPNGKVTVIIGHSRRGKYTIIKIIT
ncbi:MAG: hypothetical protein EHM28_02960, partial [Spirochaetaceae bacterium]